MSSDDRKEYAVMVANLSCCLHNANSSKQARPRDKETMMSDDYLEMHTAEEWVAILGLKPPVVDTVAISRTAYTHDRLTKGQFYTKYSGAIRKEKEPPLRLEDILGTRKKARLDFVGGGWIILEVTGQEAERPYPRFNIIEMCPSWLLALGVKNHISPYLSSISIGDTLKLLGGGYETPRVVRITKFS